MEKELERWRRIDGCPYWVSNMGRIRSRYRVVKSQFNKKHGYYQAMVYMTQPDGTRPKPKLLNIATTVGRYWLGKAPHEGMVIRHKSEDKNDNRASNLTWAFRYKSLNDEYGITVAGRKPQPKPKEPMYRYVIKQLTQKGLLVGTYCGFEELEAMGFRASQIKSYCRGGYPNAVYKGFKWELQRIRNKKKQEDE